MSEELAVQVAGVGALVDPVRRALYLHVAAQAEAVSREQAATALDLPLHTAKFHLDRLVEEGLLEAEFRRLSGRTGPGAGRPSKLYRRSSRQVSVSLPERHYELAGEVLATAVESSVRDSVEIGQAVQDVALAAGRRLGSTDRTSGGERDGLVAVAEVLARHGYEPRTSPGSVTLANCPFDRLASRHTELVCSMNLALVRGVVEGVGAGSVVAELAPRPGSCCVALSRQT